MITDELREYANIATDRDIYAGARLCKIADRIDREHRMAMEKVAAEADALPMTDESMAEHGWAKLPKDADGVPVRVGDVMEWPDCSTAEVVGIGNDRFFYIEDGIRYSWVSDKIHHHASTVEDVLREFAEKVTDSQIPGVHPTYEEAIAEYAAKLRLAEEVDE